MSQAGHKTPGVPLLFITAYLAVEETIPLDLLTPSLNIASSSRPPTLVNVAVRLVASNPVYSFHLFLLPQLLLVIQLDTEEVTEVKTLCSHR